MVSVLTGAPFRAEPHDRQRQVTADRCHRRAAGGFFPAEMKNAGFDGVVFWQRRKDRSISGSGWAGGTARRLAPVGVGVVGDRTRPCGMRRQKVEVACCGPGGRESARTAAIINMRNRAAGRTGLGAVMGSEEPQGGGCALVAPYLRRPQRRQGGSLGAAEFKTNRGMQELGELGTAGVVLSQEFAGGLPTRNYQSGHFEHAEEISGERLAETILVDRDTAMRAWCAASVRSRPTTNIRSSGAAGPEYETIATFGSYCEIAIWQRSLKPPTLQRTTVFDTIGAGATIAWAIECYEDGILTDTDGLGLRWGDAKSHACCIEAMAFAAGGWAIC